MSCVLRFFCNKKKNPLLCLSLVTSAGTCTCFCLFPSWQTKQYYQRRPIAEYVPKRNERETCEPQVLLASCICLIYIPPFRNTTRMQL
ncbi:hypothetical protein ACQKWADRAFT_280766 [Trichoderma austrokoningii]